MLRRAVLVTVTTLLVSAGGVVEPALVAQRNPETAAVSSPAARWGPAGQVTLSAAQERRRHAAPRAFGSAPIAASAAASGGGSRIPGGDVAGPADAASSPSAPWRVSAAAPCGGLDSAGCLMPFPDDYYTAPDSTMPNGIRVDIPEAAVPQPVSGSAFVGSDLASNDGFSPGSTILTSIPGLSLAASDIATQADIGASLDADAPAVLLDATTGQRWPYWAELDVTNGNLADRQLMIHPARNLAEGDRYVVALRDLRDTGGNPIPPELLFADVLSGVAPDPSGTTTVNLGAGAGTLEEPNALVDAHLAHLRAVVAELAGDGVDASGMYLAWDFTVASTHNLTAPALHMRDEAFAALGDSVPTYTVTQVANGPFSAADQPTLVGRSSRYVEGHFAVPNFLDEPGGPPGSVLRLGADGLPETLPGDVLQADFTCEIPLAADADPTSTSDPVHPARLGLYGHGLFLDSTDVLSAFGPSGISQAANYAFCSTDWLGMTLEDVPFLIGMGVNLSLFPSTVDRLLQSFVDAQVLGRIMENPAGFAANRAFENASGTPLIDTTQGLVFEGNSLGGMLGGALTAVSSDIGRAVLADPSMDFEVALPRSSSFVPFSWLLDAAYPDRAQGQLIFDLLQMLWDRADTDGYAEQLTSNFLPGSTAHQVLLGEAFGDHHLPNVQTDTEARTIGAGLHEPALAPGRSPGADLLWGLDALPEDRGTTGSALYVWDSGVPPDPATDVVPTAGNDPHNFVPRTDPDFWLQAGTFFDTGEITNPCGDAPCTAPPPPPTFQYPQL